MKTLQLDKLLEAEPTQRDALATILPPCPGQIRTREICAIDEYSSRLHLVRQLLADVGVLRPD